MGCMSVSTSFSITKVYFCVLKIGDTNHSFTKTCAYLGQNLCVLVVGYSFYNSLSTLFWIAALENARTNKYTIHAKLHHQCGISWSGNTTRSKVYNWKSSFLCDLLDQIIWS